MNFRSAGRRCAVDFNDLQLPISVEEALEILAKRKFYQVQINMEIMVRSLRDLIGASKYRRGALMRQAPKVLDCSSLTKWIYKCRGIYIPRHSVSQRDYCKEHFTIVESEENMRTGDIVFTTGKHDFYWDDINDGVGHVGFATGEGTVIHAANSKVGIIESTFENFIKGFRGIGRIIENDSSIITIESPTHKIVEESNQFRWMILQHCEP